jgi:hypothetical protein
MADERTQDQSEQAPAKSGKKKTVVLGSALLGVMAIEAAVVFVLVKHFGAAPSTAEAIPPIHGVTGSDIEKRPQVVELDVVKLRAQNERAQRLITYDLDVYVSVSDANKEKVSEVLQRRKATVQDRLARVVRAAEPERFIEPDLRTLRKQFQVELTQIVGEEGLIVEVLIPSIVSSEN